MTPEPMIPLRVAVEALKGAKAYEEAANLALKYTTGATPHTAPTAEPEKPAGDPDVIAPDVLRAMSQSEMAAAMAKDEARVERSLAAMSKGAR